MISETIYPELPYHKKGIRHQLLNDCDKLLDQMDSTQQKSLLSLIGQLDIIISTSTRERLVQDILETLIQYFNFDAAAYLVLKKEKEHLVNELRVRNYSRKKGSGHEFEHYPLEIAKEINKRIASTFFTLYKHEPPHSIAEVESFVRREPIISNTINEIGIKQIDPEVISLMTIPLYVILGLKKCPYLGGTDQSIQLSSALISIYKFNNKITFNSILELKYLSAYLSLVLKFNLRSQDEHVWGKAHRELLLLGREGFAEDEQNRNIYPKIFRTLKLLRLSYISIWRHSKYYLLPYKPGDSLKEILIKKDAYNYFTESPYSEPGVNLLVEPNERTNENMHELPTIEGIFHYILNDVLTNRKELKFDYQYFFDKPKPEGTLILRDPSLLDVCHGDYLFFSPIFNVSEDRMIQEINEPDTYSSNNRKTKDMIFQGLFVFSPQENYRNLLFYNKETLQSLSTNIFQVIQNSINKTQSVIFNEFKHRSKDVLDDYNYFLNEACKIIKKFVHCDSCSIILLDENTNQLRYKAGSGLKNTNNFYDIECKENSKLYKTFQDCSDYAYFGDEDPTEFYEHGIKNSINKKMSILYVPIFDYSTKREIQRTLGVIRLVNFRSNVIEEHVSPFPQNFIELVKYISDLLAVFHQTYLIYSSLQVLLSSLRHELVVLMRALGNRLDLLEEQYRKLKRLITNLNKKHSAKNTSHDEMDFHNLISQTIKKIDKCLSDCKSETSIANFCAVENIRIIEAKDIELKKKLKIEKNVKPYGDIIIPWINILNSTADKNNKILHYRFAGKKDSLINIPKIETDPRLLQIIIYNLVHNAIHYSHQGTIIHVDAYDKGNSVEFCVQNLGIGILEKEMNLIFKLCGRGSNAPESSDKESGLGIGLYVVDRLLKNLDFTITVESEHLWDYSIPMFETLRVNDHLKPIIDYFDIDIETEKFLKKAAKFIPEDYSAKKKLLNDSYDYLMKCDPTKLTEKFIKLLMRLPTYITTFKILGPKFRR